MRQRCSPSIRSLGDQHERVPQTSAFPKFVSLRLSLGPWGGRVHFRARARGYNQSISPEPSKIADASDFGILCGVDVRGQFQYRVDFEEWQPKLIRKDLHRVAQLLAD